MAESLINRVFKKIPPRAFSVLIVLLTTFLMLSCENDRSKEIPLSNVWEHQKYQNELLKKGAGIFLLKIYKKLYESNINNPYAFYLYSRAYYRIYRDEHEFLKTSNTPYQFKSLLLTKYLKFQKNPFILSMLAEYYYDLDDLSRAEYYSNLAITLDNNFHLTYFTLGNINLKKADQINSLEDKVSLATKSIYYFKKFKTGKFSDNSDKNVANFCIEHSQSFIAQEEVELAKIKGQEENSRGTESSNSASNECSGFGNQGCIEKIRSSFGNTGKNILEEQYLGDGRFRISFMDSQYPGAYNARISTDCNCNITSTNVSTIR